MYIPAKRFDGYPTSRTFAIGELSSHSERADIRISVVTMGTYVEGEHRTSVSISAVIRTIQYYLYFRVALREMMIADHALVGETRTLGSSFK